MILNWIQTFYRLSIVFIFLFIHRICFIAYNHGLFPKSFSENLAEIFLLGARFDLTTIIYLNLPFIIIALLINPWVKSQILDFINKYLYFIANTIIILVESVDLIFYQFNFKRMTSDVFGQTSAIPKLLTQFMMDYWWAFIFFGIQFYILYKLYEKCPIKKQVQYALSLPQIFTTQFVFALLIIVGFRGGLQKRPLKPMSAGEFIDVNLTPLVMPSTFTLAKSMGRRTAPDFQYFNEKELASKFNHERYMDSAEQPKNIVVLLVESLGREHIHVRTPFLDSLIQKSTYYPMSFANGRRSNEGLVSILASLPMLMDDPFMHSVYAGNKFLGMPKTLDQLGYDSYFMNGSPTNLLAWTEFLNASGVKHYINREHYKEKKHDDGRWGIYDHYFLPWAARYNFPTDKKFFTLIFTLSSHHPFLVPEELKSQFSETDPYKKSIQYTDYALKLFFEEAQKKKWFKNTIFIITADHTLGANNKEPKQGVDLPYYQTRVGLYATPFIVYDPNNEMAQVSDKLVSQIDIGPTVLQLAGYKGRYFSFGESIFSSQAERYIYHYVNGIYSIMDSKHILLFDGHKSMGLYDHLNDAQMKNDLTYKFPQDKKEMEEKLKAYLQTYFVSLKKNRLSY